MGFQSRRRGLHIALWFAQALLAVAFGMAGSMKLFTPIPELAATMPFAGEIPGLVRFIGAAEFAAAFGMILPAVSRVKPWLTPLAGVGLSLVMVLAAGYHASRGEWNALPTNVVLGVLAAFVAWGRATRARISERR